MNSLKSFSLSNALTAGFKTYIEHFALFAKMTLAYILFCALADTLIVVSCALLYLYFLKGSIVSPLTLVLMVPLGLLLLLFLGVTQSYYHYQIIRFGLTLRRGQTPLWTDIFGTDGTFQTFFFARLLYVVRIFLWSLLLIIPGIYQATRYYFTGYSIVDSKTTTVSEDKKVALSLSAGIEWSLLFLLILGYAFMFPRLLLLILEPILVLAGVDAYQQRIDSLNLRKL